MTRPDERDPYQILRVSPNAEPEVIESAYRRLARKYHPDVDDSPDATERMKLLNWAYSILSDPDRRREHDRRRRSHEQSQSSPPPESRAASESPSRTCKTSTYRAFASRYGKWTAVVIVISIFAVGILITILPHRNGSEATLSQPTPFPTPAPTATLVTVTPAPEPTPTTPDVQSIPTGDPAAYLASGKAHLEAGEVAQAITALEAAVYLAPDLIEAQFYLGNAYTAAGRLADAEARFVVVLQVDPDHLSAHSNLGVIYLQMERIEDAQAEFRAVLALDETDAEVHYLLGVAHVRLGQLVEAREKFERAIALDPELPEPYFGLGTVNYLQQETEKAIEAFETFLSKGPAQDPAAEEEARRILAVLKGQ